MADKISLKCIHDLLGYRFVIPSYQRGYRWTTQEVNDLLDDIWEFTQKDGKSKKEFYCLQPIVVTSRATGYSVIDGQQRLTTIYIILGVLKEIKEQITKTNFTIEYETRKDSENFLKNIDLSQKEENIDYYYICNAHETVKQWFNNKPEAKLDIIYCLLKSDISGNNVKVIWYEIDSSVDPINIFTRINMGKIPLTNAELVKALFLRQENFSTDQKINDVNVCRLRQLEMATEWDNIEYSLWNQEFWYFLINRGNNLDNRIEFIFDLIADKSISDKFFTFRYFNRHFNEPGQVENNWKEIKKYFLTFSEWFDDREYYHLIGYLITTGEKIKDLKQHSIDKTKTEFKNYLKASIKSKLNCDITSLDYDGDKDKIKKVMLLFNIITLLDNNNSNVRFQFGRYKTENWDIEHIHSVQSEMPSAANHQEDWLNEVFKFTDNADIKKAISDYRTAKFDERDFKAVYEQIVAFYGDIEEIGDISNLTLLDSSTNRGYKNAVFPIKRKQIIEKDRFDTFIPLCTKNVFLKYYNENVDQMNFWGKADRQAYLKAMTTTLSQYVLDRKIGEANE